MDPRITIAAFDSFLAERGLRFEAVVIGGTALNLLGVVHRTTRDCDVLHPEIPANVLLAAHDFAAEQRASGDPLQNDWLNNGPASLTKALPPGWHERLVSAYEGRAIVLRSLGAWTYCEASCLACVTVLRIWAIVLLWPRRLMNFR